MNKMKISLNKRVDFLIYTLLFIFVCGVNAQETPEKITLSFTNLELSEAINKIQSVSSYKFFYDVNQTNLKQKVSLNVEQKGINEVMTALLRSTDLTFEITNKQIALMPRPAPSKGKMKLITGTIVDNQGEAVIGANVSVKGTTVGTITDIDGRFSLEVPEKSTLQVSYIGYMPQEIKVDNRTSIDIALYEDLMNLEEVVVIGYGTMKKSDLTGAVSSIKGEKISSVTSNDITDILQGKVAGMNIVSSSQVGEAGDIRIRGDRSLNASNDPLVIIDGVPGRMESVNTNDIESIEVLKDAASTAVYGSRGANGVIMITTKRAGEQKTKISYNGFVGVHVPNLVKMQSGDEYIQFRRDGFKYRNGWDKPFTDEEVFAPAELEVINNRNFTDWSDLLYRNGKTQSHYVSLSSGSKVTKFHLGLNYTKDEGYSKVNYNDRFNITLNLDHSINKYVTVGLSARLQNTKKQGMIEFKEMLTYMTPLAIPYNEDGSLNYYPAPQNTSGFNVLANYDKNAYTNEKDKNAAYLTGYIDVKILKNLSNRANISYNVIDQKHGYYYGENSYERRGRQPKAGKEYEEEREYTFNNILTYDNSFGEHNLVIDGVFEATGYTKEVGKMSGENQPVSETTYHKLETSDDNIQIESAYQKWTLASFLARARWDYQGKYYANFAIRADGASRLAEGNKWAYFPSGGVAWRISEEEFFGQRDWLNSLKIRLSYGSVGNSAIDPYQTLAKLDKYDYLFGEDAENKFYAYRPSMIPNKELTWEISRTTNAGIDFALFNNRISGYVEGYYTKTTDLLMERTLPFFTGFSKVWQNIGETENKGIEINLQAVTMKTKDFSWETNATFARNWSEITELLGGGDLRNNSWFIGEPLRVFYDYEKIGIWQLGEEEQAKVYNAVPGDIKVKDQNGDGAIGELDKIIIGQKDPKYIASLHNSFKWKGFDASFSLNMTWGHTIKPNTYSGLLTRDGLRWMPAGFKYWTPDNPSNEFTRADKLSGYDPFSGTSGYMKGDNIKIQDITIGYNFSHNLIPAKLGISRARIYAQIRNLGYIYKACKSDVSPEAPDFDYNIPTSYTLGINIDF